MNVTPPWKTAAWICCLFLCSFITGGCSSRQFINLNIHTEPEGSHLVYRIAKERDPRLSLSTVYRTLGLLSASRFGIYQLAKDVIEENKFNDMVKSFG